MSGILHFILGLAIGTILYQSFKYLIKKHNDRSRR